MSLHPVLIDGQWRTSSSTSGFQAMNPQTRQWLPDQFPISDWDEIESAVSAAYKAFDIVRNWPGARFAEFLEAYALEIEQRIDTIVATANSETALPVEPRLKGGEMVRTLNQIRQGAAAARDGSWKQPVIDTATGIRSMLGPIGPVVVFGPNNFPLAFNSIAGGDFVAAIAAGNPVIAKGHSSHPHTTMLFAQAAHVAATATNLPPGFIQLIYRTSHSDGARLVSHPHVGATGYTGSRKAGLALKEASDRVGKPIYVELSSINPVFFLPGALEERASALVDEFVGSCLMGVGQFCTNPGLVVLPRGEATESFISAVGEKFAAAPVGTLLGDGVATGLKQAITKLQEAGAVLVTGDSAADPNRCCAPNTLLRTTGADFLNRPDAFQEEAFGNCSMIVVADDVREMRLIAESLEGNLTGSIYSATSGADDASYDLIAPALRQRVGRLLNDKMPTGVAVSPAMNHGGPFPATGHPGFTAVGIPASLRRFAMLQCYDNVREHRLPAELQNTNPTGTLWRTISGQPTQSDVPA
ncbi:MAG: aldehyde dehydrogenase (NADP(+)) [Planctomycetaceae bacterium]